MIEFRNVSKTFDTVKAVDCISATIEDGHVFGLIGTNGAGKSTLMRMLAGVFKPDEGTITVDGEGVFDNPTIKGKIFYISDDQYFFRSGTPKDMLKLYMTYFPEFDEKKDAEILKALRTNTLNPDTDIYELVSKAEALKEEIESVTATVADKEKELKKLTDQIKAYAQSQFREGDKQVEVKGSRIVFTLSKTVSNKFDEKAFKEANAEVYAQYLRPTETLRLTTSEIKEEK